MAENALIPSDAASGRSMPIPLADLGKGGFGGIMDRLNAFARQPAVAKSLPMLGLVGLLAAAALVWAVLHTGPQRDLFSGLGNPVMIDAEVFCDAFLPEAVPQAFADLAIPLTIVATDYYGRRERAFTAGPLRQAVAASMAIPGAFRPVRIDGQVLVDGATVNPLPLDHLTGKADILVGIDVSGAATIAAETDMPGTFEAMFGALQIMQAAIVDAKAAHYRPDILIRPNVGSIRALDFARSSVVLRLARPAKEELKRKLGELLERG